MTAVATKTIKSVLNTVGYNTDSWNNRQRAVRSINSVLSNSDIEIIICDKGMVWRNESQQKYNFVLFLKGVAKKRYYIPDFESYTILKLIGKFLLIKEVRDKITADVEIPHKCCKCEGRGVIPQFYYYADGVCFDCLGLGVIGKLSVKNVNKPKKLTGFQYIGKYYISENFVDHFPENVTLIKPINFIEHPTAKMFLGEDESFYYIYQPICKANGWYKIPRNEFELFKPEYKKATRIEL